MVHAAVVMDDENSIIIVGERHAMDLGEILKILVNIEAEYWNRIWIDFENRNFGQSGTDGVSRNIFIGIYSYVGEGRSRGLWAVPGLAASSSI